jgi:hypothetical protein
MIVVADTSPPLHLGRIGKLDLLPAVVGRVIIPRTVWGELVQPGTRPDVVAAIQAADWIDIVEDPVEVDLGLDPGETAQSCWRNDSARTRCSSTNAVVEPLLRHAGFP